MKSILVIICARSGSRGIKNKNIRLLKGKPLIAYTVKQATEWGKAKHVVVSTDSQHIADIAHEYGAEVPFLRSKELALDTTPKLSVLRDAVRKCERVFDETFDIIIDLQSTSPIRKPVDIQNALDIFLKEKPKSLVSVVRSSENPYFTMIELGRNKRAQICKNLKAPVIRRQDAPEVYTLNGSIYIYPKEFLMNEQNVSALSDDTSIYIMDEYSGIDIDRESDLKYIEFLMGINTVFL